MNQTQARTRILVTGFGAFPGAPFNPTQAIVRWLTKFSVRRLARLGIDLRLAILPVTYAHSDEGLRCLLETVQPDIVLHLGLAARRKTVTVETRGLNRLSILKHDASKQVARSPTVAQGAPFARAVTLPVARLMRAVTTTGLAARASINAGDYVCNHTLYVSLMCGFRAGFIHVPRSRPGSRPRRDDRPRRPDIAAMARAVEAVAIASSSGVKLPSEFLPRG